MVITRSQQAVHPRRLDLAVVNLASFPFLANSRKTLDDPGLLLPGQDPSLSLVRTYDVSTTWYEVRNQISCIYRRGCLSEHRILQAYKRRVETPRRKRPRYSELASGKTPDFNV